LTLKLEDPLCKKFVIIYVFDHVW